MKKIINLIAGICLTMPLISWATSLSLSTEQNYFVKDCPIDVKIIIDTKRKRINTVDIKLIQSGFEIIKFTPNLSVFPFATKPKLSRALHITPAQKAYYIMLSTNSANTFQGKSTLWTITIIPTQSRSLSLDFYMKPGYKWDDSNAYSYYENKVQDTLNKANGIQLQEHPWTCPVNQISDTQKVVGSWMTFLEYTLAQAQQKIISQDNESIFPRSSLTQTPTNFPHIKQQTSKTKNTRTANNDFLEWLLYHRLDLRL